MNEINSAIIKISTADGSGSGFYLSDVNLVVTNHHVVAGNRTVSIETQDQNRYPAKVIMVNPVKDLAFLQPATPLSLPALHLERTIAVQPRDKVAVLGYPFGRPFTITEGIISSTQQLVNGQRYLQTDAAINPGNSGGPLVNEQGKVIGVTTCKFMQADNMGFALPADEVMEELQYYMQNPTATFAVKCPSCNASIFEPAEFCESCGASLDSALFEGEAELSPLAQFVEPALEMAGIDPVIARSGPDFWEFHRGSALIRVFIYKQNYLYATCPMVKLPKQNLEPFYRYLLSDAVEPYFLGIYENVVHISYRAVVQDIHTSHYNRIQQELSGLFTKADELDNFLIDTYQCERSEQYKEA